jgi:hypothetical protein
MKKSSIGSALRGAVSKGLSKASSKNAYSSTVGDDDDKKKKKGKKTDAEKEYATDYEKKAAKMKADSKKLPAKGTPERAAMIAKAKAKAAAHKKHMTDTGARKRKGIDTRYSQK